MPGTCNRHCCRGRARSSCAPDWVVAQPCCAPQFLTRLVLYPYVVWSAHLEAQTYLPPYGIPEWSCVGLLYVLLVLQVYWMYLIAKVAVKLAFNGEAEDIRSSDEEDIDTKDD